MKWKTDVTGLDEFDLCIVRRTVYDYKTENTSTNNCSFKEKFTSVDWLCWKCAQSQKYLEEHGILMENNEIK
jgi:hypothetical protein